MQSSQGDMYKDVMGQTDTTVYIIYPGGELQEAEISLPIVSLLYTIDLSRTRSHYIPGVPLDVVVSLKFHI